MSFRSNAPVWQKLAAGILLLWAFADLSIPGVCQSGDDEAQNIEMTTAVPTTPHDKQQNDSVSVARMVLNSGQPTVPNAPEDCFCCCAHVVPTPHFSVATLPEFTPVLTYSRLDSFAVPVAPLYHPPRA